MTDPLGQSQVIPYLEGLTQYGYRFTLLSCEKPDRYAQYGEKVAHQLAQTHIRWKPIPFHARPPVLAKIWDSYQLHRTAAQLHNEHPFGLAHCRSYMSAEVGRWLQKKFGVKFIFDMRGFWADERVDGGIWNMKNPLFQYAYRRYKQKEADFVQNADAIVSLTQAGSNEMRTWKSYTGMPIDVIPCSADFKLFTLATPERQAQARTLLQIDPKAVVVSYIGTLGTWYMLPEMLQFFQYTKQQYPNAIFLMLTPENPNTIWALLPKYQLSPSDFRIQFAPREELPLLAAAANISLCFIKPTYAKLSSSPTKLGELLAMGIPVFANNGVGDIAQIIAQTQGGVVLPNLEPATLQTAIQRSLPQWLHSQPENIRYRALDYYDLKKAVEQYANIYKRLLD